MANQTELRDVCTSKLLYIALLFTVTGTLGLVLQGCEVSTAVPEPAPITSIEETVIDDPCTESFLKTVSPIRISGSRHLYFDPAQFSFLEDSQYQISEIVLRMSLKGKFKGSDYEIPLAINGLQAVSNLNSRFYELLGYNENGDQSEIVHNLHKMIINGASPIRAFMSQVKTQKGEIKLSAIGSKVHVLNAWIELKGTQPKDCGDPTPTPSPTATVTSTPTPTPTPTEVVVAPKTTITSAEPSALLTNSTVISIAFTSDQMGVQFLCSLNSEILIQCNSPFIASNLASGAYTFKVFAKNSAGMIDAQGASHSWIVDTIAPSVTITNIASLPARTASGSMEFSLAADDPSANLLCSLDGAPHFDCLSPISYGGLADGIHSFSVKAKDLLGNLGVAAEYQWIVDQTPPVVQIVQTLPSDSTTFLNSMNLSYSISEAAQSVSCTLDGVSLNDCASPLSLSDVSEGLHRLEFVAKDLSGNASAPASYSWSVDRTPPAITIGNVAPASFSFSNASSLVAEFSISEEATTVCFFDGIATSGCHSPFVAPVLSEGNHELVIKAYDSAGNESSPVVLSWVIDYQAPVISFGSILPSAATYLNANWLSAEVIASENTQLSYLLNGSELQSFQSPLLLGALPEGQYQLSIEATDLAGNIAAPLAHAFVIDLSAPVVTASASFVNQTKEVYNEFAFSANEQADFECNLNGAGFASCSSPWNISGFADGAQELVIRAIDLAGNVSDPVAINWDVDTTAPITQLAGLQTSNTHVNLNFSSNEPDSVFECYLDGASLYPCVSPLALDNNNIGNHLFAVYALDSLGNRDPAGASFAWTVDPMPTTTITATSPSVGVSNQTNAIFSFRSNVVSASFKCRIDGGNLTDCSSPFSYSGLANGSHQFQVFATDRFGALDPVGASYSWLIDTIAPTIPSLSQSIYRTSITITWTTNEPATTRVSWGQGLDTSRTVPDNGVYTTSHTVTLSGLYPNTQYSFIVGGMDQAKNLYQSTKRSVKTYP